MSAEETCIHNLFAIVWKAKKKEPCDAKSAAVQMPKIIAVLSFFRTSVNAITTKGGSKESHNGCIKILISNIKKYKYSINKYDVNWY